MHRIAKFHFVSPAQFMTAMQEEYPQYTEEQIKEMYEALKLPKSATKGCRKTGYCRSTPEADWALNTDCR